MDRHFLTNTVPRPVDFVSRPPWLCVPPPFLLPTHCLPNSPKTFPQNEISAGIFAKKYRLGNLLGYGSFGCIYLVQSRDTKEEAVTKFIRKRIIQTSKGNGFCNFPLEIKILSSIRQQVGVVSMVDLYENDYFYQIVMEKHGDDVTDLYKLMKRVGMGLHEPIAAYLFRQIAKAVLMLYRGHGILHRDLKPSNLLINNRFEVQVIDFGSAIFMKNEPINAFHATPIFRSPEAVRRQRCIGLEVEIWALGVTLYYMVFNSYPFKGDEAITEAPLCFPLPVSADLATLLAGMLDRDQVRRWRIDQILANPWVTQAVSPHDYNFYG